MGKRGIEKRRIHPLLEKGKERGRDTTKGEIEFSEGEREERERENLLQKVYMLNTEGTHNSLNRLKRRK